jgi:type III pantothenate kinase
MLLAIDIGNTQTVIGLFAEQKLLYHWRLATRAHDSADELLLTLNNLFKVRDFEHNAPRYSPHSPGLQQETVSLSVNTMKSEGDNLTLADVIDAVIVASVVPSLTAQYRQIGEALSGDSVFIVNGAAACGLPTDYDNPDEIGADRIADAIAALSLYGAPVVVVDFGTATNIEVINKDGRFVGGIIAPGLKTSANALFAAAARLAKTEVAIPPAVIGRNTKDAICSGLSYGEIDRIDGLVARIFAELGYRAPVVATGGLSHKVAALSRTITVTNDDLTLIGLRLIWEKLSGK